MEVRLQLLQEEATKRRIEQERLILQRAAVQSQAADRELGPTERARLEGQLDIIAEQIMAVTTAGATKDGDIVAFERSVLTSASIAHVTESILRDLSVKLSFEAKVRRKAGVSYRIF